MKHHQLLTLFLCSKDDWSNNSNRMQGRDKNKRHHVYKNYVTCSTKTRNTAVTKHGGGNLRTLAHTQLAVNNLLQPSDIGEPSDIGDTGAYVRRLSRATQ